MDCNVLCGRCVDCNVLCGRYPWTVMCCGRCVDCNVLCGRYPWTVMCCVVGVLQGGGEGDACACTLHVFYFCYSIIMQL